MNRTSRVPSSWLSPLLEGRDLVDGSGHGVFAVAPVPRGALLIVFGGSVLDDQALARLDRDQIRLVLQIDEHHYLWSAHEGPADWVNHSCEPNAGLQGPVCLVARRRIRPGEQVTYDYCMSDGSDYDEFPCRCGSARCRGVVSGADWRRPELWARYQGAFSPYLARRIAALQAAAVPPRAPRPLRAPGRRNGVPGAIVG